MTANVLTMKIDKQAVRDWLKQQIAAKLPPPDADEIRRQLSHNEFLNRAECAR
jgi:hypothetical protein